MFTAEDIGLAEKIDYNESVDDVKLPKRIPGCGILIKMIGELQEEQKKTGGLIILSEDIKNRSSSGSVLAEILQIGDNAFKSPRFIYFHGQDIGNKVAVGDRILIKRMAGTVIPGSKGVFQIIEDDAIMGIY